MPISRIRSLQHRALIVLGPYMPAKKRRKLIKQGRRASPIIKIIEFDNRMEELIAGAKAVVAMGGYNTYCEILSFDKPALIVPRVKPRQEQLIRARRAAELGLIEMLLPEEAEDADALCRCAEGAARTGRRPSQSNPRSDAGRAAHISRDRRGTGSTSGRAVTFSRRRRHELSLPDTPQDRRRPEGLSAAFGNLHRAGTAGPGAGRLRPGHSSRCGGRPTASATRCMTRSRRLSIYLPEYLHEEPLRVVRSLLALSAAARLLARARRAGRRPAARLDAQPRSAASGRRSCWPRNGRKARAGCMRISSIRRHR